MELMLTTAILLAAAADTGSASVDTIKLPPPALDGSVSVERCLAQRRSIRRYSSRPLTLAEVSQLLWAAYGVTEPMPNVRGLSGGLKTAPSAGGLYPLELYVVAGNVTSLEPGIYRYRPETHDLILIQAGDRREPLARAALGQTMVRDAPASLVYSAVFSRTTGKYGSRGRQRYVCMDLGHSAQNVYLQCGSLGLGTCAVGAFDDAGVRKVVPLADAEEPLYIMPVGHLPAAR